MSEYSAFADRLNQYLADRDRSATWLAQRLGVNPSTVARWCSAETRPGTPELVGRLADVLGVYDAARRTALLAAAGYAYVEPATHPLTAPPPAAPTPSAGLTEPTPIVIAEPVIGFPPNDATPQPGSAIGASGCATVVDDWLQPLTRFCAQPLVQASSIAVLLLVLLASLVRNRVDSQPLVTVQYFAIAPWQNLSPGRVEYEALFTEGTRRILYDKLSLAPALQGVAQNSPQVTDEMRGRLNFWIEGDYQQGNGIQLTATIFGRNGLYLDTVSVHTLQQFDQPEAEVCILDLQDQLARQILATLQMTATQEIATAMTQTPTHSCAALRLNNQAVDLVMRGGLQSAQTLLERAFDLDPNYADVHSNLGQVFYRQEDWVNAVTYYQKAIALQPANAIFHYNLGVAYERQGEYAASIQAYQQAIDLDPLYVQALNNLGFTYLQQKNVTEALALLRRGLELAPDAYYLHKNLGRVYLEQNDTAGAIQELQQAITLFGSAPYAEALYYLGLAYQEQGQIQEACAIVGQYLSVADKDETQRADQARALGAQLHCVTK